MVRDLRRLSAVDALEVNNPVWPRSARARTQATARDRVEKHRFRPDDVHHRLDWGWTGAGVINNNRPCDSTMPCPSIRIDAGGRLQRRFTSLHVSRALEAPQPEPSPTLLETACGYQL